MIKLKTECNTCSHAHVCRYKHNAKLAMDKFRKGPFISVTSNDSRTWEDKMMEDNVLIEFSCPDFVKKQETLLR